ncbi:hypothetical protein BDY17DRAFT_311872 [Neohortaea acidophila]|uniref:Uncharacterized protein n=1 Tax=Neohortaea acidophila TaxID=245834 RepID=A0A6A6PN70_9PEZI|nr:uncharacterized protein BDY17DRAFT_311872 [Neohortaea acidophila]KAF2481084.1 hypothetical protein BDY17DRAFT_311872 [Neohortaea acidophila]
MPKNPLKFARRKSAASEEPTTTPAVSSFRVLERPQKINLDGYDRTPLATRPINSPSAVPYPGSIDRLDVCPTRASNSTITSNSSGYYSPSARHSSTSTLPSSVDAEKEPENEELFPRKGRTATVFEEIPFNHNGTKHQRAISSPYMIPAPPVRPKNVATSPERKGGPRRERALTTASYVSTTQPILVPGIDPTDFVGDDVFRPTSGDRWDDLTHAPSPSNGHRRTDTELSFPPQTHSGFTSRHGSPDIIREMPSSPYAWDRRNSSDRLMSSSPRRSPSPEAPPVPLHRSTNGTTPSVSPFQKSFSPSLERSSPPVFDRTLRDRPLSFLREQQIPGDIPEEDDSFVESGSRNATPRAARWLVSRQEDGSLFGSSPTGTPSRAVRPRHGRSASGSPKRMTKAQFEQLQKTGDSNSSQNGAAEEHDEADEYEDDDDMERATRMTKQRQRQEANMSLYRQQMRKVTGAKPTDTDSPPPPNFGRVSPSGSASIHLGGLTGAEPAVAAGTPPHDEEDEDVPLGILQAHGFPRSSRSASRCGDDVSSQLRASGGPSHDNLPPFARRLPVDPYYGAALGQSAAAQPHPGGLVGIIADEERAKAARRGGPNAVAGGYGRAVSSGSALAPQMYAPSAMSMMGLPQMQMMAGQSPEQMQQFMHMQMQLMQNMLAMQQQQQQPGFMPDLNPTPLRANAAPSIRSGRAMSMLNPPSIWEAPQALPRPKTCAPSGINMTRGPPSQAYTPSIAPSERSNVGLPSRYRPVAGSSNGNSEASARTASTSSVMIRQGLNDSSSDMGKSEQGEPPSNATIRAIDKPKGMPRFYSSMTTRSVTSNEDEEEEQQGWAEMQKSREERQKKRKMSLFAGSAGARQGKELSMEELVRNLN